MNRPIVVTGTTQSGAHAWQAAGRRDLAPAFRAAMRHSRHVRVLRIAVPVAVAAVLAAIAAIAVFNPLQTLSRLPNVSGTLAVSGSKITMELPRLSGFTRDSRPYELVARSAAQDLANPHVVELKDIRAKVETLDKNVVNLVAEVGVYDTKSEKVALSRRIVFVSSSGYEGRLTEAVVDVRKGHIVSEKPVEILMHNGVINANRLEIVEGGTLVRFDNGVAMTLAGSEALKGSEKAAAR